MPITADSHRIAEEAHEYAIMAHEDAIRRRSARGAIEAAAQTQTACEQSDYAGMAHDGKAPTAMAEAEDAVQGWENGRSSVAQHRAAIRMHRDMMAAHRAQFDAMSR